MDQSDAEGAGKETDNPPNPAPRIRNLPSSQSVVPTTQTERVGLDGGTVISLGLKQPGWPPAPLPSASLRKTRVPQLGNTPLDSRNLTPALVTGHLALVSPQHDPHQNQAADIFCLAEHGVSKESQLVANFEKSVDFT